MPCHLCELLTEAAVAWLIDPAIDGLIGRERLQLCLIANWSHPEGISSEQRIVSAI
jgi:hypothetical protein